MSSLEDQIGVGIIGCGKISQAYFDGAKTFDVLNILACADLHDATAKAKAKEGTGGAPPRPPKLVSAAQGRKPQPKRRGRAAPSAPE